MIFKIIEILSNSINHKKINILGYIENEIALITLEKQNFIVKNIENYLKSISLDNLIHKNDSYLKYEFNISETNILSIIYDPSLETINKLRNKVSKLKLESNMDYLNKDINFDKNTKWIQNILNGSNENEKIIYQDNDFILLPDYKWTDYNNIDNIYYLGIAKKYNNKYIKCLREINFEHLNFLEKMLSMTELIEKNHNLKKNSIISYVHYPPSFYIFHVHYVYINNDMFKGGFPRNILLTDIIQNIKIKSDYYQKFNFSILQEEELMGED